MKDKSLQHIGVVYFTFKQTTRELPTHCGLLFQHYVEIQIRNNMRALFVPHY